MRLKWHESRGNTSPERAAVPSANAGGVCAEQKNKAAFMFIIQQKRKIKKQTYLAYFLPPAAPELYIQLENVQDVVQVKHFRYVRSIMYLFNGS